MRARGTQRSGVTTAHRERSDLPTSSTNPGFAFEFFLHSFSPRRALFSTANANEAGKFLCCASRASRERDGLALNVSNFYNNSVRLYIAHSRMLSCSLILKKVSTNIIYAPTYLHYQKTSTQPDRQILMRIS